MSSMHVALCLVVDHHGHNLGDWLRALVERVYNRLFLNSYTTGVAVLEHLYIYMPQDARLSRVVLYGCRHILACGWRFGIHSACSSRGLQDSEAELSCSGIPLCFAGHRKEFRWCWLYFIPLLHSVRTNLDSSLPDEHPTKSVQRPCKATLSDQVDVQINYSLAAC